MARTRLVALLLVPLAFLLMGSSKVALVDPDPIQVPAGVRIQDVARAIRTGLSSRHWMVTKDENNQIEAVLNVPEHMLKVSIPYSTTSVSIKYVDSQNLDYSEMKGVKYIHEKWVGWTRNMRADIQRELQLVTVK